MGDDAIGLAAPRRARTSTHDGACALLALACSVAASGCMVGPEYARPRAPLSDRWTQAGDPRLATNAAVDVAWWTGFEDPALDRLIDRAYRQELSLEIARLRIEESRARIGVAIGEMFPTNPSPIASGQVGGLTTPGGTNTYGQYFLGVDAAWEIDLWGRQRHGVRAARADLLAGVADYEDAVVSLNAEIASTYVLMRTLETLIEQAETNVAIQEQALDIARARFRHGATSELDVAQASTLLETTRSTIPRLRAGRQQARNALSTLLGRPSGYVDPLLRGTQGIPTPPARVSVGVPAELLRRRPDIRAAELHAIAQCHRVGQATADLYPSFTLTGFFGTPAIVGGSAQQVTGRSLDPGSLLYGVGAGLLWPLFNYPQIVNNIAAQDAVYAQSLVEYRHTVLVAAQEVEDGMVGFILAQEAVTPSREAVASAELAVSLALVQYREGATDYMRVLDTQRVLLDAQRRLAESRSASATNAIALYKALGGGWEIAHEATFGAEAQRREAAGSSGARRTEDGAARRPSSGGGASRAPSGEVLP